MKGISRTNRAEALPDGAATTISVVTGNSFGTVMRPAEYIGSFIVNGQTQKERTDIVYKKLESLRNVSQKKSVLLVISLSGIKICNETGESVRMAHALRRISYATSDPDFCQFSFLAREPKGQANVQYCHTFITKTSSLAEELNDIVGEAFRLAYTKQKQITVDLVVKRTSFNDVPDHKSRRHSRPSGKKGSIEEIINESIESQPELGFDGYNLLSGDKNKKPPSHNIVQNICSRDIPDNPVVLLNEKVNRSSLEIAQTDKILLTKTPPNDFYDLKVHPRKPLPNPPIGTSCSNFANPLRSDQNNYDETDDLAAEVLMEQNDSNDVTPPWMYANRSSKSAFVSKPQKKPVIEPHQPCNPDEIFSQDRPFPGPHVSVKVIHPPSHGNHIPDQLKFREFAPLPPQRMDSLPCYDFAERGSAEGESGVGTGAKSLLGKYDHMTEDTSTLDMGSTSGSSGKSVSHDPLKEALKWPEKWYQPDIPREVALDLLSQGQVGSFVVRDSSSHTGCYALSVRISKSFNSAAVIHYLIQRTSTGFKLKGLEKEWPTMKSLVTHLTVMPEMLPCALVLVSHKRHTTTTSNPAFCPIDVPPKQSASTFQDALFGDEDDLDYQSLSDFSSIMADLCLV